MDGILLFNKPILWTSHDAVDFVRRRAGQRAVGHAGTLDPLATGLLVLLLGNATKLSAEFSAYDKDYSGSFHFGMTTDTQDMEGRLLEARDASDLTAAQIQEAFRSLQGTQPQTAPLYSAVKKNGKKLCDWTRQGVSVERTPRTITVTRFDLLRYDAPEAYFSLSCSKGTYVRALCDAAGSKVGVGATLSALVRDRVGPFLLTKASDEKSLWALPAADLARRLLKKN